MDKTEEIRRLYEVIRAYRDMYENQQEYINWLEAKVEQLCRWQKTIIGLSSINKDNIPDSLIEDITKDELEHQVDEEFRRFCSENGISF